MTASYACDMRMHRAVRAGIAAQRAAAVQGAALYSPVYRCDRMPQPRRDVLRRIPLCDGRAGAPQDRLAVGTDFPHSFSSRAIFPFDPHRLSTDA